MANTLGNNTLRKTPGGNTINTVNSLSRLGRGRSPRANINKLLANQDTQLQALLALGRTSDIPENVDRLAEPKKMSFLQRLGTGLTSFETGNALYNATEGGGFDVGKFGSTYAKDVGKGLLGAFTGNQKYADPDKKTYADMVENLGIDNAIAKFGLGLAGDILFDPSTYFGGFLAKNIVKGVGKGTRVGVKGVNKFAPGFEEGVGKAFDSVADAFVLGRGSSKGVKAGAQTAVGRVARLQQELSKTLIKRFKYLSDSQRELLAESIARAKAAEFKAGKGTAAGVAAAKKVIGGITDKTVQKEAVGTAAYAQKFAKEYGLDESNLFHSYYPTSDINRVKKAVSGSSEFRVGSENYKKQYKNIVGIDDIQKDPATAFFKPQAEMIANKVYREELDRIVKDVGLPLKHFKNTDEAAEAGYKLLKEKGGIKGKSLGWVKEADHKVLQTFMSPDLQFVAIDRIAKHTGFDAVTNLFKRSVTGLFAPFHVRNYVSGFIQGYETVGSRVFDPRAIKWSQQIGGAAAYGKVMKGTINVNGTPYKLESIKNLIIERFGLNQGFATEGLGAAKKIVPEDKFFSKRSTLETFKRPVGQESQVFKATRGVTNFVEIQNKANIVVASLLNGKTMDVALELAEKGAFDYKAMTAFESKVLRRIVPFYSFTRKNLELQAKTMANNPERISNVIKLVREIGDSFTPEDKAELPEYMKQAFNIETGKDEFGQPVVTSQLGTPIEQAASMFSGNPVLNIISQMNPAVKVPLELGFGVDSFRERDINMTYDAKEYSAAPKFLKDFLMIKETEKPVYRDGEPTGETKTQYVSDPTRLLIARSLFTSRGVSYLDKIFDGDIKGFSRWLQLTTGVKPQPVDEQTTEYFKNEEVNKGVQAILKRRNIINQFANPYVSKNNIQPISQFRDIRN